MTAPDVYLREHDPARDQYRSPRRSRPTGLTVVHTAESVLDTVGPDTGAEAVAAFIRSRTTPGSYHDLADSDSVLQLVRYGDEAYQDGTGSNPFALSISFALRTTDWRRLTPQRRAAFLAQGAKAFARQQAWLRRNGYPTTPLRRVTRAQSAGGMAGFISHAERDPDRRSDPGADFPWTEWFRACAEAIGGTPTEENEDDMPTAREVADELLNKTAVGRDDNRRTVLQLITESRNHAVAANAKAEVILAELGQLDGVDADALAERVADRIEQIKAEDVAAHLAVTTKEQQP